MAPPPSRWPAAAAAAALLFPGCAAEVRDSAGQVTAPTTTDSFSVQVGDCLDSLPSEGTSTLTLLPCEGPHHWEAFATANLTGEDFPGNAKVRDEATQVCEDAFAGFVGISAGKSRLDLTMLAPTAETWAEAGDRAVVCLVGNTSGGITGTLENAEK